MIVFIGERIVRCEETVEDWNGYEGEHAIIYFLNKPSGL